MVSLSLTAKQMGLVQLMRARNVTNTDRGASVRNETALSIMILSIGLIVLLLVALRIYTR